MNESMNEGRSSLKERRKDKSEIRMSVSFSCLSKISADDYNDTAIGS